MRSRSPEKMFTFLRGVCSDGKHPNTSRALGFARSMHEGQTRDGGEPYIIHPLSITCDAVGLSLTDDVLLATLILHDVPEDTGVHIMDLPVDDEVRNAVECLTLRYMKGESKLVAKKRYFSNLTNNFYAIVGKGLDRCDNLPSLAKAKGQSSVVKNLYETEYLLLPQLKEAKMIWPEYSNQFHSIRVELSRLVETISFYADVEFPEEPPNDKLLAQYIK